MPNSKKILEKYKDVPIKDLNDEIVAKPLRFDKELYFSNVRYLLKQRGIGLGDVEIESGNSQGYTSRLDKPGNRNTPNGEYMLTVSQMTGVSIDDMLSKDFKASPAVLSESEKYMLGFLKQLKAQTEAENLIWEKESIKDLMSIEIIQEATIQYANHPLFDVKLVALDEETGGDYPHYENEVFYNSRFYDYGEAIINGSAFHASLTGTDASIYLMNVFYPVEGTVSISETKGVRELYMCNHGSVEPLCCTEFACEEIRQALYDIYTTIEDRFGKLGVSSLARNIINQFMDATTITFR